MSDIQQDFKAALEQVADGKRTEQARIEAEQDRKNRLADSGAEWLQKQIDQLDQEQTPEPPAEEDPASDPADIFNHFPKF